ncbi:MAG: amidohydrolase family protein [Planctomycetota bacterium]
MIRPSFAALVCRHLTSRVALLALSLAALTGCGAPSHSAPTKGAPAAPAASGAPQAAAETDDLTVLELVTLGKMEALGYMQAATQVGADQSVFAAQRQPQGPVAFVGARLLPISAPPIENGVLVIDDGRIVALGPAGSVSVPADATQIPCHGLTLMPGLVDTHSHIGGGWGADESAPIQPDVRLLDAIDVRDATIQRAQAGGITTANLMSGSGHLMSGQTAYLKLRDANTIEELLYWSADGLPLGGMKMANGTNSQRSAPFPGTRGKSAALVREQFVKALSYRDKLQRAGDDAEKRPERDLGLEALLEVLDGRRMVHHHTHRHDDILTVLRLQQEFGFRVVLHHVSEGWKVADEIATAGVGSSLIMIDSPGGKLEAMDFDMSTGAALERRGAAVAFHTDDWINDSRLFLRSAALGVRGGMSREGALAALTINGARMLDLQDRIGSLEVGKDADLVLLNGDPLALRTAVVQTWAAGELVFDDSDPRDHLWAVGGWGAGRQRAAGEQNLCCFGDREEQ